jgi:hypothetical protein
MKRLGFAPKYVNEMKEVDGCCRNMKVQGWYDLMRIKKSLIGRKARGGAVQVESR